jgi:hypothetical protein
MALQRKLRSTSAPAVAPAPGGVATATVAASKAHMFVAINFGECPVGMGMRYVVATRGRKWVHLFYIPTLTAFSVSPEAFTAMRPRSADEIKPSKMRRMLREKRALYDGLQLQYSGEAADRAKASLKAIA